MSYPQDDPTRPSAPPAWTPVSTPPGGAPPPGGPPQWTPGSPQQPLFAVDPPRRRGRSLRWALAAAVTAIVLVAGVALAFFANSSQTTAALGPTFLPATTVAYVEARLDLPGDQRNNLVSFLGRFPGLADPATFEQKVNDTLDRLTRQSSAEQLVYTRDIKPWFEGEISIGITSLPTALATGGGAQDVPFVGALSVSDRGALERFMATVRVQLQAQGATFTEVEHGGTLIVTAAGATPVSYAITDDLLYFAVDVGQIQAALDVRAGTQPSLGESEPFKSRFAKLPAERLGAFFVDLSFLPAALAMTGSLEQLGIEPEALPTAIVGSLRVEADRVTADLHALLGTGSPVPPSRTTALAQRMPAGTMFYTEQRDVGAAIGTVMRQVKAMGVLPPDQLTQLELALGVPAEDAFAWVQDAALAVSVDGDRFTLGLVATVTDETLAAQRIASINTLVRAGIALSGGVPAEVVDETVAGATLTTIRATEDAPVEDLPFEPSVSYTLSEGVFYLGVGDFVAGALQRPEAEALASDARYTSAVEAAGGATNSGVVYLDLVGVREAAERSAFAAGGGQADQQYQTEIKPYLEPFDRLVLVYAARDGAIETRLVLLVR